MDSKARISLMEKLLSLEGRIPYVDIYYDTLQKIEAIKHNYYDYFEGESMNVDREYNTLQTLDYDHCCALITMMLREDHFSYGSFEKRLNAGQPQKVIERMIMLLSK